MAPLLLNLHTPPFNLVFKKPPNYAKVMSCVKTLDTISSLVNINIAILDYYKHEYAYLSAGHIFLCGYTNEEVMLHGEKIAETIIHEDDKIEQANMKDAAFYFMKNIPQEKLKKINIYSTHRLKHKNGSIILISNKYKPIAFDDDGNPWLIICVTTIANKNHNIETYIELEGERHVYSPKLNQFLKSSLTKLSEKEHEILSLSSQGFTSKEISKIKNISPNTVKFHKQNILNKFNVDNISEAILYAYSHNLF